MVLILPAYAQAQRTPLAAPLDDDGKLLEALPRYRARAETTLTKSDQLHYAGALLRAGRAVEAKEIYDRLAAESKRSAHNVDQTVNGAALCASSLLRQGFPVRAVDYARAALAGDADPAVGLLLIRALAAAGDADAARTMIGQIAKTADAWTLGQRIELARSYAMTGDLAAARTLLEREIKESIGQMFRDSILATPILIERNWAKADDELAQAERKVPSTLNEKRVNRLWRNAQRELRTIQLRRAIALWKLGKRDAAVSEAAKARASDEEYVRTAALMLLISADYVTDRRPAAQIKLSALAGHDVRFADAVQQLETALAAGSHADAALGQLKGVLSGEDRSADAITALVFEILGEATAGR